MSIRQRSRTVEELLESSESSLRRRHGTSSRSNASDSNNTNKHIIRKNPLLPQNASRTRSNSISRPGAFTNIHVNQVNARRRKLLRSDSLEDQEEFRKEPMLTIKSSPRTRYPTREVEFWSKNNARRYRRTSVSALCPYPDLLETTRHLRNNITVGSRRKIQGNLLGTKYKQVFSGKTATIFLQKYICDDQHDIEGARDIGTWMMREQFIVPVSGKARTGGSGKSGKIFSSSAQSLYRFNDAMLSPYHLHVVVHHATGLLGKRSDGSSYPFGIIECQDQIGCTRVLANTLTPHWNEKFLFGLYDYNNTNNPGNMNNKKNKKNKKNSNSSSSNNNYNNSSSSNNNNNFSSSNNNDSNNKERTSSMSNTSNADDDSMIGMALKISLWTEKTPFLNQHAKSFLGYVNIQWKDIHFVENTDRAGNALDAVKPMTLTLQKRSIRSNVRGKVVVSVYVTRFHYSSYIRTRCHSSPVIESDPTYKRSDISNALDGKILIPKSKKEMRSSSSKSKGTKNSHSNLEMYEQKARDQAETALNMTDFILWDLVIDLDSLNDIDYRGIATDLNVASALLLPGMSWKQRVIAHIRSPTKDWLMLPSQWIKRSQSVFQSNETEKEKKEKGQREETSSLINSEFATTAAAAPSNIIRVDGLSSDDIENNVLHLRVRQDNTWSLNNNSDAGRELGRTSEFPLSSLPKILVSPGVNVIAPAYVEHRMTAYTSITKKRRTTNGNIRAAMYLVPSAVRKEDKEIAKHLINERVGIFSFEEEKEKKKNNKKEKEKGNGQSSGGSGSTGTLYAKSLEEPLTTDLKVVNVRSSFNSSMSSDARTLSKLSKTHVILEMTCRAPYELIFHYLISDHSYFMSMNLGREGCTSVTVGKWKEIQYLYMLNQDRDNNTNHNSTGTKGSPLHNNGGRESSVSMGGTNSSNSSSPSTLDYNSSGSGYGLEFSGSEGESDEDGEENKEENKKENKKDELIKSNTLKPIQRSMSFNDIRDNSVTRLMENETGGRGTSQSVHSTGSQESGVIDAGHVVDGAITYTRTISWIANNGVVMKEIQVIRKNIAGCCIVDMYRTGGIYSKRVYNRLCLENSREGVTRLTITSSKRTPRSIMNILRTEAKNMHTLLRVVVAQAGVERIEKSTRGRIDSISELQQPPTSKLSFLQIFTLFVLIFVLVGIAVWRSGNRKNF